VLCILSICLLILHLSVAICEICLLYFTYGVCLVLSLKPGVTVSYIILDLAFTICLFPDTAKVNRH
jgi:hypothetical protein